MFFKKKQKSSFLDKYIRGGYLPASSGVDMKQFVDWIKKYSNSLTVKNIFEIGANFAQDADFLSQEFNISPKNVYVFEAHPDLYKAITKLHQFNAYNYAVYNENKEINFNILPISVQNTGLSSILNLTKYDTNSVKVKAVRMDTFMQEHNISNIDFLKLDVEGCNFEVLEGFGDRLSDIKCIHLEAEHALYVDYKEKNYLYTDIKRLLKKNGFELVFFQRYTLQSDSFWVQKQFVRDN